MISDTFVGQDHGTLYHLIQKDLWQQAKASGQPYFPPTYEAVSEKDIQPQLLGSSRPQATQ
jgi:hypothetical protein